MGGVKCKGQGVELKEGGNRRVEKKSGGEVKKNSDPLCNHKMIQMILWID